MARKNLPPSRIWRYGVAVLMMAATLTAPLPLIGAQPAVKNPDTFVFLGFADWTRLDPAWAADIPGLNVVLNVYEPLIFFDGSRMDRFVPMLTTVVPSLANGLISGDGRQYTFPIRRGVRFHHGGMMTAEDVAYSLRRLLLSESHPGLLLREPILGMSSSRDEQGRLRVAFADLQRAVQVKGNDVIVTLKEPFAAFLSIMAGWSYVVPKQWAIANDDWDGTAATMARYNATRPESTALFARGNGTGPFKLQLVDRAGRQIVLARHDRYWRTPATLSRVVFRIIEDAAVRILMLKAGDADSISLSRRELPHVEGDPNIRVIDDLPIGTRTDPAIFFTFHINPQANPDIGSGRLDGNGIPPDFFADVHVRRGFGYAFDFATFLQDGFRGKGTLARGMIPLGMLGYNPRQEYFTYDREKAIGAFKEAWGGQVWERGFRVTAFYQTGSVTHELAARILKEGVESLNPRFRVELRSLIWSSYLAAFLGGRLPIFLLGWFADYADPHNFAFHFVHSGGAYPRRQKFKDEALDRLVVTAITETDPKKREAIYFQINRKYFEVAPSIATVNAIGFRVMRSWVRGWYYNPIFPGTYFYTIFKG